LNFLNTVLTGRELANVRSCQFDEIVIATDPVSNRFSI
jgi:hypothetical protein